jgi:membrane protein
LSHERGQRSNPMNDVEARRARADSQDLRSDGNGWLVTLRKQAHRWLHRSIAIARDVGEKTYDGGFMFAGNFAYLALLALFPFFIIAANLGGILGRSEYGDNLVNAFLVAVPPTVGSAMADPVSNAMSARTGPLLWLALIVGLWTTASLIESMRIMIRQAYGVKSSRPFWHYRLGSMVLIIGGVMLTVMAFSMQVMLTGVEQFLGRVLPFASSALSLVAWGQIFTTIMLFGTLYAVLRTLTPAAYRGLGFSIWPGPLFISMWWMLAIKLLPFFLSNFANYDLTYGSLAGVMISLIFFFLIGLAMVIGAELNAALARDHVDEEQQNSQLTETSSVTENE